MLLGGIMAKRPEILHRRELARSRFFAVEEVGLRFSNGVERLYERLAGKGRGAVMVAAINSHQELLLIREYGVGMEDYSLGLPKGAVDADETLEQAANRELQEETGFAAKHLTVLRDLSLSPSYMSARISLVLAEDLYPSRLEGDEPEPLEVIAMPLDNLEAWAWREDVHEGRSIAALFLVRDYLRTRANTNAD
jgi:ADP-ribose diphosphatase